MTTYIKVTAQSLLYTHLLLIVIAAFFILLPQSTHAATSVSAGSYDGEVAGWIPWWTDTAGIKSATKNIKKLDTVYPFVYEVGGIDASITDKANLDERQWKNFIKLAKKNKVEVIPSIAWFDGVQIDYVLSDKTRRADHIKEIVDIVKKGKFDGINIDYEGKQSKTIDNFSLFLKELNSALGSKLVTCAIEARTPAKDLYTVIPNPLQYANDYKAIGQHCDRIELMTYDQQRADLTLNAKRAKEPYAPVADTEWVEKVVALAVKDFPKEKVLVGIATYGRAWDVTVAPTGYRDYTRVASLNMPRIEELSKDVYKTPIGRTSGGEGVITYFPDDSPYKILAGLPTPAGTPKGFENAAKALLYATMAKSEVKVRFVSFGDAISAGEKLQLVDKYSLRGAAFFKIDGEEDQAMWKLF